MIDWLTGALIALLPPVPGEGEHMVVSHYGQLPPGQSWNRLKDGSVFRPEQDFVAAHRTLPIGTRLLLTNPEDPRRRVVVDVLDRGPFVRGRDLDISTAAARELGIYEQGVAKVEVRLLPPQEVPLSGLLMSLR
ncbi:septal ring lytic transglycosylase RlpA family protein [Synechococcus sp. B60.1]|uniref:septal ring lytic transglycosylase RlpA family protein n=1 Tax=unclassified Synechococcus TaxID=2626047 RepID=UPI0039C3C9A6